MVEVSKTIVRANNQGLRLGSYMSAHLTSFVGQVPVLDIELSLLTPRWVGEIRAYSHWIYLPWRIPISFKCCLEPKYSIPAAALSWVPYWLLLSFDNRTGKILFQSFLNISSCVLLKFLPSFFFGCHLSFVQMKSVQSSKSRFSLLQQWQWCRNFKYVGLAGVYSLG